MEISGGFCVDCSWDIIYGFIAVSFIFKITGVRQRFGLSHLLSTHSAGRWVAVKAGRKPVHFSLVGCPLSCYPVPVSPLEISP